MKFNTSYVQLYLIYYAYGDMGSWCPLSPDQMVGLSPSHSMLGTNYFRPFNMHYTYDSCL